MNYSNVIIKPLITEKSVAQAVNGKYTFLINTLANKTDVITAAKKVLGVTAKSVRIVRYQDHRRRVNFVDPSKGSRIRKTVNFKKAIIELDGDQKLDYFDVE
ncbi:MAG: 50S ribosomal protein L23 [bacterium]